MPTRSDRRIALLGTGIMGAHMARRLAQAGFAVTVWNRSADKAGAAAAVWREDCRTVRPRPVPMPMSLS